MSKVLSEKEFLDRLETKLNPDSELTSCVLMRQVRASDAERSADAISVNLWRSRGYTVEGYEVKRNRADLLKELKDPSKAEAFIKHVDKWWLIAPKTVVGDGSEVPPGWGIMVPHGTGLRVVRKAAWLRDAKERKRPMSREFLVNMIRRAAEQGWTNNKKHEALSRARQDGYENGYKTGKRYTTGTAAQSRIKDLQKRLDDFQELSGIKIRDYGMGDISAAVAIIARTVHYNGDDGKLEYPILEIRSLAKDLKDRADALEGIQSKMQEVTAASMGPKTGEVGK